MTLCMFVCFSGIDMYEGTNWGMHAGVAILIMFSILLGIVLVTNVLQKIYIERRGGRI